MSVFLPFDKPNANTADELRKELQALSALRKGRDTQLALVDERGGELLKKYADPRDKGQIYYLLAHIHAQSGLRKPEKVIEYVKQALSFPIDFSRKMRLYVYWGDAMQVANPRTPFSTKRKSAVVPYLKGLRELQPYQLPEKAPELPAVFRYTMNPKDPDFEKMKLAHDKAIAARQEAKLKGDMVRHRDVLEGQIVSLYSRRPLATEELKETAMSIIGEGKELDRLMAAVNDRIAKLPPELATNTSRHSSSARPTNRILRFALSFLLVAIAGTLILIRLRRRAKRADTTDDHFANPNSPSST